MSDGNVEAGACVDYPVICMYTRDTRYIEYLEYKYLLIFIELFKIFRKDNLEMIYILLAVVG